MRFAIKMAKFAMNLLVTNARRQEIVSRCVVAVWIFKANVSCRFDESVDKYHFTYLKS